MTVISGGMLGLIMFESCNGTYQDTVRYKYTNTNDKMYLEHVHQIIEC